MIASIVDVLINTVPEGDSSWKLFLGSTMTLAGGAAVSWFLLSRQNKAARCDRLRGAYAEFFAATGRMITTFGRSTWLVRLNLETALSGKLVTEMSERIAEEALQALTAARTAFQEARYTLMLFERSPAACVRIEEFVLKMHPVLHTAPLDRSKHPLDVLNQWAQAEVDATKLFMTFASEVRTLPQLG